MKIQPTQPTKRKNANFALTTAAGAAIGSCARYVLPLKNTADEFVSSSAKGAQRSILKYAGAGALIAAGANILSRAFSKKQEFENENFEYSKYAALIDAPDYACEILWWGDK